MHVTEPSHQKRNPQPAARAEVQGGWHWAEWGCELAGTALLLLGGRSGLFHDPSYRSTLATTLPVAIAPETCPN